jgi:nitroreductase
MELREAINSRRSIRDFSNQPVSAATIRELVAEALRAPSGGNLQPWRVYAVIGSARDELVRRVRIGLEANPAGETPEYHIYPPNLQNPYELRRTTLGKQLYTALGIPRGDRAAMQAQANRNFEFFGAPAGLIFTMDRQMQQGQWADLGMFMQTIMLLARAYGLHTCPQEAWARWHGVIREFLEIPQHEMVFCGMAIGHAIADTPANRFVSERVPLDEVLSIREHP